VNRRPIQLIHPVWNVEESKEVYDSIATQIDNEGLSRVETIDGRPILRLSLIELSDSRETDVSSFQYRRLVDSGIEIIRINSEESENYLNEFLTPKERVTLNLDVNGIGTAREACTIIATCALDLSDNPIIWFLDDDLQFRQLGINQSGMLEPKHHQNLFEEVWSYHERHPNVTASLGGVTGCPPLRASSSLLCNMGDLLASVNDELEIEHDSNRWDIPDYYYDLSENLGRRNTIFPNPNGGGSIDFIDAILCHGMLFRPIVLTNVAMCNIESERLVRGGNSLIYDLSTFVSNPYPTLELRGIRTRRGDTVWSCLNTFLDGNQILSHNMKLHHGRTSISWNENEKERFINRMLADLYGASFYRTITAMHAEGEFRDCDELLHLAPALYLVIKSRAQRHGETLKKVEVITNKIGAANNNYYSLSTEVFNICKLAQEALSDIPSEEELQVALIDCWSRITVWREKIGPNLIEKMSNYHS